MKFIGFLFLFLSSQASASELRGVVRERGTKKILADVNVFLVPQGLKATTNEKGEFVFSSLVPGPQQVVVNLPGYKKFKDNLQVSDEGKSVNLFIEREIYTGFETVVVGEKNKRDDQQRGLKPKDFLTAPGAGGDPIKAVQNLPGINRAGANSAQIVIQGAEPEDTRFSIDEHEIPLIFHFGGLSSVLFPESVESVFLLPAGYGPEFGRANGGQVGLVAKKPRTDRWGGLAFMDIFNVGAMAEGPLTPTSSLSVGARYSYVGEVLKKVLEDNESVGLSVAPSFADLSVIYANQLNDKDEFKLTTITSSDKIEFLLKETPNNDPGLRGQFSNEVFFYRLIPQWSRKLSPTQEVKASLGLGYDQILNSAGSLYFNLKSYNLSVRGEYNEEVSDVWKTYVGIDNRYTWADLGLRVPTFSNAGGVGNPISIGEQREAQLSAKAITIGTYWRNEIAVSPKWTVMPGLRLDLYRPTNEVLTQPRFAARFQATETLKYRLATGVYFQPPSGQQSSLDFGNPEIKSPLSYHLNLGVDKDFREGRSNGSQIDTGLFYKKLDRVVVNSSGTVTRNGVTVPEFFNNSGSGRVQGAELSYKYTQDLMSFGVNYTYSQSWRSEPGQPEYPSEFDQTHNLNLLGSYQSEKWLLTGRFRFVTGSPLTPIVGGYYDSDQDVFVPERGPFYSQRNPPFMQADLRAERKWIKDTWILSAYVDIQNLLNRRNVEGYSYSYDYKESVEVMGLGILPTFGIKGEF